MRTQGLNGLWPAEWGGNAPKDADIFHHIIFSDEVCRVGSGGMMAAIFTPNSIALPPILHHASDAIKQKVIPRVVRGEATICLAVTEPWGGSDVASIRTRAIRKGDFYYVTGEKKFITGGGYADFFTTAVRTGDDAGMGGISLLLLEKDMPGITVRRIKTTGWWMSYTAHIVFDNVKVPVSNLIGQENQGFLPIMTNFNMERFGGIVMCLRFARVCLQDAVEYARVRKTFGKNLNSNQVIRHKFVAMASRIEALQAWTEWAASQVGAVNDVVLGKTMAMMKVEATRMLEYCSREACQVLGGASYVRGGPGERIERISREVRVVAIGGGSEEILVDFAAKLAKF